MSLLSLQAAQSKDPVVREALVQAQARINALALVHRIFNEVEDQTVIDLQRLLTELTQQVVESVRSDRTGIIVETDVLQIDVAGEIAVPLALFTVEALVNIFKHAFPQHDARGAVSVVFRQLGDSYRLAIEDNGVGFSDSNSKSGIGDRLLRVFGRQVHGAVSIKTEPGHGTSVELLFPVPQEHHAEDQPKNAGTASDGVSRDALGGR
jgi:two-component sensor histidine kinase